MKGDDDSKVQAIITRLVIGYIDPALCCPQRPCETSSLTQYVTKTVHILEMVVNTLRPLQNGHPLPDDIYKNISLNEKV